MSPAIRVLLADNHPIVQRGLAAIINEELDMTAESPVKSNINCILSKLGAKDRTQTTIICSESFFIEPI